jgi:predicted nucleic acid-binding Zn ribbon protein
MIYEFRCNVCSSQQIVEQSIHDELKAPTCVCGNVMSQVLGVPGIKFVGEGFAKNDK